MCDRTQLTREGAAVSHHGVWAGVRSNDSGNTVSAPVSIGVLIGAVVLGTVAIQATTQLEARHRADFTAENAALAAADIHFGWADGNPCELAERIAEHGRVELVECVIQTTDVLVEVRVRTLLGERLSTARAGVDEYVLGF